MPTSEDVGLFQPPWLAVAKQELGQAEIAGEQDNPRIVEYHKSTKLKATDDETPWCSAFCNWCMLGAAFQGTDQANARSWLAWGKSIEIPAYGCVTVLQRGTGWQGHVGFFVGKKDGQVAVLGGNQGNAVSVAWFPEKNVLGYRWPA